MNRIVSATAAILLLCTVILSEEFVLPAAPELSTLPAKLEKKASEESSKLTPAPKTAPETAANETPDSETIVVTATRLAVPKWETGSSLDVVTTQQINEAVTPEAAKVIEKLPGLSFAPMGTPGQQTSLFIRGGESDHTLMFQDGMRVNDQDSSLDFGFITTMGIESIEVLRGTGSTLYGTDAVTGVVNMNTVRGEGPWHLDLSAYGGSFGSYRHGVTFSGQDEGSGVAIGVDTNFFGGTVPNSDNRQDAVFGRADVNLTPKTEATLIFRRNETETGWYGNNGSAMGPTIPGIFLDPNDRISGEDSLGVLRMNQHVNDRYSFTVQGGVYRLDRLYNSIAPNDTSGMFPPPTGTTDMKLDRAQANWTNEITLDPAHQGKLLVGLEYLDDAFREVDTRYGSNIDKARHNSAGFAEYHLVPVEEMTAVTGGVRVEDNSQFGTFTTYRLSVAQRIVKSRELTVRGSVGKGFRAPSYTELYYPFSGNLLLKPEENLGWDAGLDYDSPKLGLKASAVYYSNDFENMIQYNFMTFTFDNIGAANSDGVEIALAYEPPEQKYSLSANVTTVSAEDSTGTELLRRPRVVTYATAGWKLSPKFKFGLSLYDTGKWKDFDETYATITMKGYTRYDAFAEWRAVQNVTIFARCENLENKLYQPVYSFPVPGRICTVGLKATVEF